MAAKTNSATVEKFISDILDCVKNLKEQFQEDNLPVTDDNILVQKLCSKLEFVLQNGLKDRTSILGNKKDYWDYICQCLASRKYVHDGIRYVKLNSEVKTSSGKGRAFLRFCLVHGCLADSLQQCFVHEATRDWYQTWAFPFQRDQWTSFISRLYDLSDVIFDLSPDCFDLDVTWPTFSRRSADSRMAWRPPSRSVSISSLNSQVQMEHPLGFASGNEFPECEEEDEVDVVCEESTTEKLKIELDQSELSCSRLQQELEAIQVSETQLRLQLQASHDQSNGDMNELAELRLRNAELESLSCRLQSKLLDCELQLKDSQAENQQMTTVIESSNAQIQALEENNSCLDVALEKLKVDFEAEVNQIGLAAERVSQLETQLSESEHKLKEAGMLRTCLLSWIERIQSDCANDEAFDMSSMFCGSLSESNHNDQSINEIVNTMSSLQRKIEESRNNERKLQDAEKTIQKLQTEVADLASSQPDISLLSKITDLEMSNISLSQELQATSNNFQCQITALSLEKDELNQTIQKLEEKEQSFVTQLQEKNEAISKANKQVVQLEQTKSVLGPLHVQQDTVLTQLTETTNVVNAASERLRDEIKTLASVLFCIAKGNYVTWEPKEENELSDGMTNEDTTDGTEVETTTKSTTTSSTSPLVHLVNDTARTISKMKELCIKNERVESMLQTCENQCRDLTGLAREIKKKLALQHFDVQGTQRVVDTLSKEHKKLQTAEAILKYELREKKKLLSNLRHQVESAREEWNRSRLKTAQSELEWHNLREEFAERHKQASEESGFVDDRNSERATPDGLVDDQNTDENLSDQSEMSSAPVSEMALDENVLVGDASQEMAASSSVPSPTPSSSGEGIDRCNRTSKPRSRLDILEEQYQLLYSSLVRSSKRSEALEQRIEALLSNADTHSKSSRVTSSNPAEGIPVESTDVHSEDVDVDDIPPSEDLSQSSISLENGPESECSGLNVTVSEESLDSESLNLISNGDGLHSYAEQWPSDENSERSDPDAVAKEPFDDLRKRTLENFVIRLKNEKMARNAKEADLRSEIQVLLSEKLELENKVLSLQQEKQLVWNKESEFRKRAEFIFRQERDSFESKLSSLSQERLLLLKETEKLKAELIEHSERLRGSEEALKDCQREFSEKESLLNSQIETLKFQMSTEAIKFERALKHYDEQESGIMDMKEKVYSQEAIIDSLEDSLREIKEERRLEKEKQWQELEELQISFSTRDEECIAMNEELKKTVKEFDVTRYQLENLQAVSQHAEREYATTVARLEGEIAQLKSDNEGLKKQIIKLVRDKDVLWKRSEALSSLQFSPTRDRWMADSEVTECLGCKATFSFTLRKHHCRLCGRIFCHDCVNHWVMTPSSSRRTRICSECYTEHIEKATSKQTTLPVDQEGSEEEQPDAASQLIPIQAPNNASFDSSSVDSLPISSQRDSSPSVVEALAEVDENVQSSEGVSISAQTFHDENSKMDFDVLSDEEISRSLSAYSPYSPARSPVSRSDSEVQSSGTRTIQDIVACGPEGVSSVFWVNAGSTYSVPVLLDKEEVILSWEFQSEPKSVAFSVAYREESSDATAAQEILLQSTRVQSHLQPVQGHLIAKHPGLYTLVFSNQFSRFMAKKVSYTLRILNFNEENSQESN